MGEWALLVKYMVSMFSETNFIYNQSTESADGWFPDIIQASTMHISTFTDIPST